MLALIAAPWYVYAIVVGLLAAAYVLTAPKKKPLSGEDQFANATRGAFIPLVIGKDRVAPVVLWIQPGSPVDSGFELTGGGQDSPGQSQYGKGGTATGGTSNFVEKAIHALCVGPIARLHAIFQNGKKIWEGPITPSTHPSGTRIPLPDNEGFRIFWGFSDDPVLPYIGTASNHGVATRYPLITKVVWDPKNLHTTRQWPRLEYEVEAPCHSNLSNTSPLLPEVYDDAKPLWQTWNDPPPAGEGRNIPVISGQANNSRPKITITEFSGGPAFSTTRFIRIIDPGYIATYDLPGGFPFPGASGTTPLLQMPDYSPVISFNSILKLFGNNTTSGGNLTSMFPAGEPAASFTGEYLHVLRTVYDTRVLTRSPLTGTWSETIYSAGPAEAIQGSTLVYLGPRVTWEIKNPTTETADQSPKCSPCTTVESTAVNPAHIISQLLFAPFPYGGAQDRRLYDMTTLEEVAVFLFIKEKFRATLLALDGEDIQSLLAKIMVDLGLFISWDPTVGLYKFLLIRHPGFFGQTDIAEIPAEMSLSSPQIDNSQGFRPIDKILFTFRDKTRNYREEPISIDDDGQASIQEIQHIQRIEIFCTRDFGTAVGVARRRSQEGISNQNLIQLELNHQARKMYPGLPIVAPAIIGDEVPLRVVTVRRSTKTSRVETSCLLDSYDPPSPFNPTDQASTFLERAPGTGGRPNAPGTAPTDFAIGVLELPRVVSEDKIRFLFPRLRGSLLSTQSRIWISREGDSFVVAQTYGFVISGGFLVAPLAVDTKVMLDTAVEIFCPGPQEDMLTVEDLTSLEESFRLGRQIAVIGNEVCFLRNADPAASPLNWNMLGLLRGRMSTKVQTHPAKTPVFIFRSHEAKFADNLLFVPGKNLYVKHQPIGPNTGKTLDQVSSSLVSIRGNAFRPQELGGLRISNLRSVHSVSEDVLVSWCYRSTMDPESGMGYQPFGAVSVAAPVQGDFRVTIRTPGDVVKRSLVTKNPFYTYLAATRSTDGFNDGTGDSWKIKIEALERSYSSDPIEKSFHA